MDDYVLYNKHSLKAYKFFSYYVSKAIGNSSISGSTGKEFFCGIQFDNKIDYHKAILESREELRNFKFDDNPVIAFFTFDLQSPEPFKLESVIEWIIGDYKMTGNYRRTNTTPISPLIGIWIVKFYP